MAKKKIVYVTGTRADFGLMLSVLKEIERSRKLKLQIFATGMHLMPQFGDTIKEVKEKFPNTKTIRAIFVKDELEGRILFLTKFMDIFVRKICQDKPDLILTLGDRVEMLGAALVSTYLGIPTAHVQGGERTNTVDEIARHAITKFSHLHLVATYESAQRIQKMGEEKWRIHIVGAPGLDAVNNDNLLSRQELCQKLRLDEGKKIALLTFHPDTLDKKETGERVKKIIMALKSFNLQVVIIFPNADPGSSNIIEEIENYRGNPRFHLFKSLPYKDFLSLEKETAVWVGNSSAAMIESSSFGIPVINVGSRQTGRQRGINVIDVGYNKEDIKRTINKSLNDTEYLKKIKKGRNPWGDGKSGMRIVKILETTRFSKKLLTKQIAY